MWDITEAEGKPLGCSIKTLSKRLTWAPIEGLLFETVSSHRPLNHLSIQKFSASKKEKKRRRKKHHSELRHSVFYGIC